MPANLYNQA